MTDMKLRVIRILNGLIVKIDNDGMDITVDVSSHYASSSEFPERLLEPIGMLHLNFSYKKEILEDKGRRPTLKVQFPDGTYFLWE